MCRSRYSLAIYLYQRTLKGTRMDNSTENIEEHTGCNGGLKMIHTLPSEWPSPAAQVDDSLAGFYPDVAQDSIRIGP